MASTISLQHILALDCPDLSTALYEYLAAKRIARQPLQFIEEEVYLVLSMLLDSEMEGFVDLFHQLYSWRECSVVEATLRKIDLHNLADLFTEAKLIFCNGKRNLTEEEYQAIDPFGDDERWQRFDTIGEQILLEGSEIYLIGERICRHVQAHIDAFANR